VASAVFDLQGDDLYSFTGQPTVAQGAGSMGGIGVLVDSTGNDGYYTMMERTTQPPFFQYVDGGVQGYGQAAVGIWVDATGNDVLESDITSANYDIWLFSQGVGNLGGVGLSSDGAGDDQWLSYGFDSGISGFQGMYPDGSGFYGGVGVMTDTGLGNDDYHSWDNATTTDYYSMGFGAFGGTGIMYEDGGDDDYQAVESATNPWIIPLLNCAFGTASYAGLGIFIELGGHDHYFGDTVSPRATSTMNEGFGGPAEGEGLFLDVSGDDGHFMESHSGNGQSYTGGRGVLLGGGEGLTGDTVGVYLDLGGFDRYTGASPSRDNGAWVFGADINAGEVPQIIGPFG
jgi:hypothetical protein